MNQRALQSVKVKVLPNLKPKDFVRVSISDKGYRIAQILDFIGDNKIHVKPYLHSDDLPADINRIDSMGKKIHFKKHELIEDGTKSKNLPLNNVLCKCLVNFLPENEIGNAMHPNSQTDSKEMYVCRYKLIKETIYKLEPIGWRRVDHPNDQNDHFLTDDEEISSIGYESSASKFSDIDNGIGQLNLNSNKKKQSAEQQLVSPIKIVNNLVQKVSRNKSKEKNESISIEQLSPSKRPKIINEMNSNYLLESPVSAPQRKTHHARNSIKKNLNSSFVDIMNNTIDEEEQNYNIIDSNDGMKMKIIKTKRHGPLKELHDNTTDLPRNEYRDKISNKSILSVQEMSTPTTRRKSILKIPGSETG